MRLDLGLPDADAGEGKALIGPPEQRPHLGITSITGRELHVDLRDDVNKSRKPRGVAGAALFVMLGEEPSADLADWRFMGYTTRARAKLTFGLEFPAGGKVWVAAQWFSTRGAAGPVSVAVSAYLQGGVATTGSGARAAA